MYSTSLATQTAPANDDRNLELQVPHCKAAKRVAPPGAYTGIKITVIVGYGYQTKRFRVFKGLLQFHCDYFQAALKDHWVEGQDREVYWPTESVKIVDIFHYFLMSKQLYDKSTRQVIPLSFREIAEVVAFADRRQCQELFNAALDLWFSKMCQEWAFPRDDLHFIYDNTPVGSPLRKLIVDDALAWYEFDRVVEDVEYFPQEFLAEVIAASKTKNKAIAASKLDKRWWIGQWKRSFCRECHDHSDQRRRTI